MAVKAHVRAFTADLGGAAAWDPRTLADALGAALAGDSALADWVATADALRVGHGAVAMHRRHPDRPETPELRGVEDFEALVLATGCLRLGVLTERGYAPDEGALQTAVHQGARWITNLLRMEPDFFDELLLDVAARQANDAPFARALDRQLTLLRVAAPDLHHQGKAHLGGRTSVGDVLRGLVGAGPNLSRGAWARWTRAVVVIGLLDAKG